MKKMLCLLLVLVLTLSLIPLGAAAAETETEVKTATVTVSIYHGKTYIGHYTVVVGNEPVTLPNRGFKEYGGRIYKFAYYSNGHHSITIPAYDGTAAWHATWDNIAEYHVLHIHEYKQVHNRRYHWMACECGKTYGKESHQDPAELKEKICSCGYKFSSNCELTTLWLKNMNLTQRFNRKTTDYTADVFTYKNVNKTSIVATPFDDLATVELPEDLSIRGNKTVFEITVTAEDKATTKTYTVTAIRPVTVAGIPVRTAGGCVSAELSTKRLYRVATATLPEILLEEMAELAVEENCSQILLEPVFSKWSIQQIDVPLAAAQLKTIAADTKADLIISTNIGTVTIPNAELASLAEKSEVLTVSMVREESIKLYADGKELTEIPKAIDRDLY